MIALIISVAVNVILVAVLCVSLVFNTRLAKFAMAFEDNITASLDDLDVCYRSISAILETPLAYDSFEVRQVLAEIDRARNVILICAKRITSRDVLREE